MAAFIALFSLWAIIAYLMYLNRAADKVLETMVVVTLAMISSIFFVLRPEKIEKDIFPVYFYNTRMNDLVPVEGASDYMFERMLLRDYLEANKDKSPLNVEKVLPNLLDKSIIDWFSIKGAWPILSISANVGGLTAYNNFSTGKPMETKIEAVRILQNEIKKLMEGNVLAPYFNHPAPLSLPKGTNVIKSIRK